MTESTDLIKEELGKLCKKHLLGKSEDEINNFIYHENRKILMLKSSDIPKIFISEKEIEDKMRRNNASDISIFDMKTHIKNIQKTNTRNPDSLICFLNLISNIGGEYRTDLALSNKHMQPSQKIIYPVTRTSTPIQRIYSGTNRLGATDTSSIGSLRSGISKEDLVRRLNTGQNNITESYRNNANASPRINAIEPQRNNANSNIVRASHNYQISDELTEFTVIGELTFMIMGIDGQWLSWNQTQQALTVRNGAILPFNMHNHVLIMCMCGVAYRRIRAYIDHGLDNGTTGVVCQGLCVALNDHLTSYLNLVSALQSRYNCWAAEVDKKLSIREQGNHFSLEEMMLKLQEPMQILFFLLDILENASDLKGGQLASIIYWYILHGTPIQVRITRNLLLHAVEPFYNFIKQWMYDGILEEAHQEFFVAINANYDFNMLWSEKYGIRTHMVPNFITESEAHKILLTGKSINFLREVCGEKATLKAKKEITAILNVPAEAMINQVIDRSFENMINSAYTVTGEYLLKIMFDNYQLMDHLKALRKYMLHGQGDFILRLLELIGHDLSKPSDELKESHMGGFLETAFKSTNAQYDPREILDRVRITFMKVAENETGWDCFTLNYQISDIRPLFAAISPKSFNCYLRVFTTLFRSRRVHVILNSFYKERNVSHRLFHKNLDVTRVLHFSHLMVVNMLHFVNQIQYYINFEVLECAWKKFMDSISKATDLDTVMKNHEYFLKQIISRCFLEHDTLELLANLRTIYDLIISFESILNDMFSKFQDELRFRTSYKEQITQLKKQGTWGVDDKREKKEYERMLNFSKIDVMKFHNKLRAHNNQYEAQLVKFLSTIIDHKDPSLRCLYVNLDFNGRYRDRAREFLKRI